MRNRTRRPLVQILALAIGLSVQIPAAQIYAAQIAVQQGPEYGPPNGTLLIAGAGGRDAAIDGRFIELGGGPTSAESGAGAGVRRAGSSSYRLPAGTTIRTATSGSTTRIRS